MVIECRLEGWSESSASFIEVDRDRTFSYLLLLTWRETDD